MEVMIVMSNKQIWSRWYEKDKEVLALVTNLKRMNQWQVEAYAKVIIRQASEMQLKNSESFMLQHGSDKHLSLLKSMGRKRWYDKNKYAYRSFNALYLMDDHARREIARVLNESTALLHTYMGRCESYGLEANGAVFEQLLLMWVSESEQDAYDYIDKLELEGCLTVLPSAS
jgi:hypothetical protein